MGFFDELGVKSSEALQGLSNKTKNVGDLVRLKTARNETEKNIELYYTQIGRVYARKHADDYEDEFKDVMAALKSAEAKLAECNKEINALNGIINCPYCNAQVSSSSAFCTSCGKPIVSQSRPAAQQVCPRCGAPINGNTRFCVSCGASLAPAPQAQSGNVYGGYAQNQVPQAPQYSVPQAPQYPEPQYSEPVNAPEADPYFDFAGSSSDPAPAADPGAKDNSAVDTDATSDSKKCPCCGADVEAGFAFCTECGARME